MVDCERSVGAMVPRRAVMSLASTRYVSQVVVVLFEGEKDLPIPIFIESESPITLNSSECQSIREPASRVNAMHASIWGKISLKHYIFIK